METRSQLSQNKLKKGDLGGQTLPKNRLDGQVEGRNLTSEGITKVDFLAARRNLLFWERAYPDFGLQIIIRPCLRFISSEFFIFYNFLEIACPSKHRKTKAF